MRPVLDNLTLWNRRERTMNHHEHIGLTGETRGIFFSAEYLHSSGLSLIIEGTNKVFVQHMIRVHKQILSVRRF